MHLWILLCHSNVTPFGVFTTGNCSLSVRPVQVSKTRPLINFRRSKGASMTDEVSQTGLSDTAASGLAYITIVPAIIFLVVAPYNQNATIRFHAWQSIFLGIVWFAIS